MRGCSAPRDCARSAPWLDADNYECTDGSCQYIGCVSDEECAMGGEGRVCR